MTKSLFLSSAGVALTLFLGLCPDTRAGDILFSDDFQSGDTENWLMAAKGEELQEIYRWPVVSDPDVADPNQKVLSTPVMATMTYIYHVESSVSAGAGIQLSFRFNEDQSNHQWNSMWTLFKEPILNGVYLVEGYSVQLGFTTVPGGNRQAFVIISRVDPERGNGVRTELAKAVLPEEAIVPGWNKVSFRWSANGSLKVFLNGGEVLSATDTTYAPAFRSLGNASWLSNNQKAPDSLPEGRKLFYDDVKVEMTDL